MSTVLDRIDDSGFSIFDSPELRDDEVSPEIEEVDVCSVSSLSSSSIGKNSDLSGRSSDDGDSGEAEVQSSYNGTLDSMNALEEFLPIRRGISNYYNGKSKSFTILGDVFNPTTAKEMAKPENAYTKKRRNLLAFNLIWDKNRNSSLRGNGGAISKRPIRPCRSTLAFAVAMGSSESISDISTDSNSSSYSRSPPCRPPLHPQTRASNENIRACSPQQRQHHSPWRSFSSADLQQCRTADKINNEWDKQ